MSKPNQKSIKSFFEGPKHPRTQESTLENVENRPSKSARISSHFSDDLGLESSKDSESDLDDFEELSESHFVKENSTSHIITTIGSKRADGQIWKWKDEYSEIFKWLKYDRLMGTASCSYHSCNMYSILFK